MGSKIYEDINFRKQPYNDVEFECPKSKLFFSVCSKSCLMVIRHDSYSFFLIPLFKLYIKIP